MKSSAEQGRRMKKGLKKREEETRRVRGLEE